jgi:hypothetical protein
LLLALGAAGLLLAATGTSGIKIGMTFKEKHKPEYRARVVAMEFAHLLFLPAHAPCFGNQAVIRFEHIQPVAAFGVEPQMTGGTKQCFLVRGRLGGASASFEPVPHREGA